jgi:hypothetical protein
MRRVTVTMVVSLAVLVVVGVPAAFAESLSPWFHLASISRPENLFDQSEVQEIVTAPGVEWQLRVNGTTLGIFVAATRQEVQAALETNTAYGAGNVQVTGGPAGVAPLIVTSVGADAGRPIPRAEVVPPSGGQAESKVLTSGGGRLAVTVINVGDATANAAASPLEFIDRLPAGLQAVSVEARNGVDGRNFGPPECAVKSSREVRCTLAGTYEIPACVSCGTQAEILPKLVPPFAQMEVVIGVAVQPEAKTGELNEASVSGGGAPVAQISRPITVAQNVGEATPFGVEDYELSPEEVGGSTDAQAGSHPFQLTTTLNLNENAFGQPAALAKDLTFKLPAGLVGNPTAFPRCTLEQFAAITGEANQCPAASVLGVAVVSYLNSSSPAAVVNTGATPIFNLEPAPGEAARFGFEPASLPVFLSASVRTGEDYGVTVHVANILETVSFVANSVTFWGVPGDPRHDDARSGVCLDESQGIKDVKPCTHLEESSPPPFLALPTSCSGKPLQTEVLGDSWAEPAREVSPSPDPSAAMGMLDGCGLLPFGSQIRVSADLEAASKPSGLKVDVHVPQEEALNGTGLAPADLRNITVALPPGVHLNPSASDGLEACSQGLVGFTGMSGEINPGSETATFTPFVPGDIYAKVAAGDGSLPASEGTLSPGLNFCSNASKIGEVTIHSPLLPVNQPLTGFVYLAAQESNPFGSLMALYIVAEDPISGTVVKLPGEVTLCKGAGEVIDGMTCEALGQIVTKFANNPQLPFEDAELHFFGGERAPLATPTRCGANTTNALFEPWTNDATSHEDLHSSSTFDITSGPNGTPCPGAQLPFSPTLAGGATNVNAGAFSPFTATMSRSSGEQNLQSLEVHLPPGLSGILTGVELCPEPQANEGKCGANSLIGETTVSVGVGGEPYTVSGGKFYLTGPYNGSGACTVGQSGCAPFGITFVVPAKAGPFDFAKTAHNHPACDCVLVRGKIEINPLTAAITITSNPPGTPDSIPTSLEGVPLEIQHVNAITTRNNFQFNPTNCAKMEVTGTIHSSEGGTDTIGVPFQVTNCKNLNFTPKFKVSTNAHTSKAKGASLTATVSEPVGSLGTQSNLARVKVDLPKQLPSRLTTLQKACTAKQFEANPAACPSESKIGYAKVITPLVPVPLVGPAIFVSHGGEAFPSLEIVLQGYGVEIVLVGSTFISKSGITSTTFKTVPDQPFSSFSLTLPTGKFSALTALGNVCAEKLTMPTEFVAQNGAEIHQTTPIGVTGCSTSIAIVSHKVKGRTLTVAVSVPAAGRVTASGKGLSTSAKSAKGRETVTFKLTQKKPGKLSTTLKIAFKPSKGGKQAKSLSVKFKK